jgi:hypothetical protein
LSASVFFGHRIQLQHLNANVPLIYALIGISLAPWCRVLDGAGYQASAVIPHHESGSSVGLHTVSLVPLIGLLALFMVISHGQQSSLFRELRRTGGYGNFNEMRTFLAYDLRSNFRNSVVFFPDWGFFTQVLYLTRGQVAIDPGLRPTPESLKRVLCGGKDALIVVDGEGRHAVADDAAAKAGVSVTRWKDYRQRDGKINFEMAIISAKQQSASTCGH